MSQDKAQNLQLAVGKMVRKYRMDAKISISNLARAAGLTSSSIIQIEKGIQGISLLKLFLIADVLKREVSEFLPSLDEFRGLKNAIVDQASLNRVNNEELLEILDALTIIKRKKRKIK
ncbi:helix-turn-helix domain-containing protein [Leptospira koniambonensis]|uniref:helix-turn-helix domain-containing protein n=1 Tax=Leptospira koniambonensis TaxID=2484950 RepID=UPI003EB7E962